MMVNVTITLGTWLFPFFFTLAALGYAWYKDSKTSPSYGGYAALGNSIVGLIYWVPAIILSLVAWLIWALFFKNSI